MERLESHQIFKKKTTFVKAFNAGVVHRFRYDLLQTVLAASAAGVHLHVGDAQLLQVAVGTEV